MDRTTEELREALQELQKELAEQEEKELIERGCYRCRGEIDTDSYRRIVKLIQPCSEGSMMQTFVLCTECQGKIYDFLNGGEIVSVALNGK